MQQPHEQEREPIGDGQTRIPRRRFVIWTATAAMITAAGAAIAAACRDVLTGPSSQRASTETPLNDVVAGDRLKEFAGYPAPTYLPPGYTLLMEEDQRPDGFRGPTRFGQGIAQVALVYRGPLSPKSSAYGATRFPLLFFATRAVGYAFGGTERFEGTTYPLAFDDGSIITVTYYDGMWEFPRVHDERGKAIAPPLTAVPEWHRVNWHALVYQWRDYAIGIRASRLCGVSFEELIKVAASTTTPVLG
jgi:hypothetical protein